MATERWQDNLQQWPAGEGNRFLPVAMILYCLWFYDGVHGSVWKISFVQCLCLWLQGGDSVTQLCWMFVCVTSGRWQCYITVLNVCVCVCVCDFREVTVLHNCVQCVCVTSGRWQCYITVECVCACVTSGRWQCYITVLNVCVCDFREVTVLHNCVECVCVTSGRWQCYITVFNVCVWLQGGDSVT